MIALSEPHMGGREWEYVKECLDTGWVSSVGAFVDRFEQRMATRLGRRLAVATVNGTSALHVALQAVGVQENDEVLVSDLTFIAPANAVRYLNAWPVFIDAEPKYWQMDTAAADHFLRNECSTESGEVRNRVTGRRVRAIMPVHILGHPVDIDPLLALGREFDLPVIEDATEALGASYRDRKVGALGRAACLSFNGNKLITTGGGGMVLADEEPIAARVRHLTTQAKLDAVEFVHDEIGYNYRLTNVQAAIGCAQLERIDAHIAAKRSIAGHYASTLADVPGITLMPQADWARSAYWLYTVLIDPELYGMDRVALMRKMAEQGVQSRPLWQPLHLSPAHKDAERRPCPVAERLQAQALSLPCSVGLTEADQNFVISLVRSFSAASRAASAYSLS
jgi:perosamine synthetase